MKRAAFAVLFAAAAAIAAQYASSTLENGLSVIISQDDTAPIVTICIAVRTGSTCQTPETCGLAHFYEHMFFKGNGLLPDQTAYNERMGELGISRNGTTSDEIVRYYITLPSERLDEGLEFMYYAIATPLFDESEMEVERGVILNEYDRDTSNPYWELWKSMEQNLHPSAPWRANGIGFPDVIAGADRSVMEDFRETYYTPDNCALIIAGDVDPDAALSMAASRMAAWEYGGRSDYDDLPLLVDTSRDTTIVLESIPGVERISIDYAGPPLLVDPSATYAADVWGTCLEMMSGEFYRDLVTEGPFVEVSAGYYTQRYAPLISFSGTPRPGRSSEALAALREEIGQLCSPSYYDEETFHAAVETLRRRRLLSEETSYDVAVGSLAFWWVVGGGLDYYDTYPDSLASVTPADVTAFLDAYVAGRPSVTFVLAPPEGDAR
jgi:zinc protease